MQKFKTLYSYIFKKYKKPLFVFLLCVLLTSSSILAIGKGLVYYVDIGIKSGIDAVLLKSLLILFAIIIILAFATFGRFFIITYYSEKIISDIRSDIFAKLLSLSAEFFEKNKVGELLSRITSDLTILQHIISSSISIFLRNTIIFIGCLTFLLFLNAKLTIIVFALVPLVVLPIIIVAKKLRKISLLVQDKVANMSSIMEENISFVKLVQSFNNENYVQKVFNNSLKEVLSESFKRIFMRSILTVIVILIVFSGVAVILYYGGLEVFAGNFTIGEFSAFLFYTIMLAGSFGAMAEVFSSIAKAQGASHRLFSILNEKPSIKYGKDKIKFFEKLEFKSVFFRYPSRKEDSLKNINLLINKGDIIAFVGLSGSGKTTILELLQRFYQINKGNILINDKKIEKYDLANLRNLFSPVTQDNMIFSGTINDNLLFANQNADKKMIREVAEQAKMMNFIKMLPRKFNSFLGDKGVRISSGEKQRIAIARAILKDAEILLFDEPTSNLDSENEKLLSELITKIDRTKTIIIIAHRLSTIKKSDKIFVFDNGEIVDSGTHQSLSKKEGIYKNLLDIQFSN